MRKFTELVYDDDVAGVGSIWYTSSQHNDNLGSADRLGVHLMVGNVGGTSPTLTVRVQLSGNGRDWVNAVASPELNSVALINGGQYYINRDGLTPPLLAYVRLAISLGGTNPSCRLKAYACGRTL